MAIQATAVWQVRKAGSNANGGGYDGTSYPGGADYSQQDAAQASGTNLTVDATTNTDVAPDGYTPVAGDVGNAVWIASGTGFTVGAYFITSIVSGKWRLDRSPAAVGTAGGAWKVGGAWADPWTNLNNANAVGAKPVPGNAVYIQGSGADNPATPDYTRTSYVTVASGDTTNGWVKLIGVNGRPKLQSNGLQYYTNSYVWFENLYLCCNGNSNNTLGLLSGSGGGIIVKNCVIDQSGQDICGVTGTARLINSEIFSSSAAGTHTQFGWSASGIGSCAINCNIHDCIGVGVAFGGSASITMLGTIVAKCASDGISISNITGPDFQHIVNCTIDGNLGNGVTIANAASAGYVDMANTIISNHSQSGKYGIGVIGGTAATTDRIKGFIDYNTFYGNTNGDVSGVGYGAHDTHGLSSNPYVASSTENYTLA